MGRTFTSQLITALKADHARVAFLFYADFASGPVYLASTPYDISYNGNTYVGAGGIGAFSTLQETSDFQVINMDFELRGIPVDYVAIAASDRYQNRRCILYLTLLDAAFQIIPDPGIVFRGRMNTMNTVEDPPFATVKLRAESRMSDWERPRIRRFTLEDHQSQYPGDRFFEYIPKMVDIPIDWGQS
jgi:hypothetical protein